MRRGLNPELGLAILRVVLGVIFIAHGAPKLIGGVGGLAADLGGLGIPFPAAAAWLVAGLESLGGLLFLVGFLVTPVALLLIVHMALGIVLVHAPNGWYVVGPSTGGVEFNVLIIAGLLTLVLAGPGLAAVDRLRGREVFLAEGPAEPPLPLEEGGGEREAGPPEGARPEHREGDG